MFKRFNLIRKVKKLGFENNEVAVSLNEYFKGNIYTGSIMPNNPDEVNPQDLYVFLQKLIENKDIEEILVRVCDIDEEWPFSDSLYVITKLDVETLKEQFKPFKPDSIQAGWMYGKPNIKRSKIPSDKVFTLWWD